MRTALRTLAASAVLLLMVVGGAETGVLVAPSTAVRVARSLSAGKEGDDVFDGASRFAATSRGIADVTEFFMRAVDRSLERIPAVPSLDPRECMKRSVCEAHNQPGRYGMMGLMLRLMFPPHLSTEESSDATISKYQQAARYGRRNDAECGRNFDGCIISPLEVAQKLANYFVR